MRKLVTLFIAFFVLLVLVPTNTIKIKAYDVAVNNEQDLRDEIAAATGVYTIALENDIQLTTGFLTDALLITSGKNIVLVNAVGGPYSLIGVDGAPTIWLSGSGCNLTLDGITVTHNPGEKGSGVRVGTGNFILESGSIVNNDNTPTYGGGVEVLSGGNFTMNGGLIDGNKANAGGGVYIQNRNFIMNGGTISNNTATGGGGYPNGCGGAIYYEGINPRTFTISGGVIENYSASALGCGIYATAGSKIVIEGDTVISGNAAGGNGGGIFFCPSADVSGWVFDLTIRGNVTISGNVAGENGGGVFYSKTGSTPYTYTSLSVGANVVFSGNDAIAAYQPPVGADATYPAIQYAEVSIDHHPLNNWDINYEGINPARICLFYDANGGTTDTVSFIQHYDIPLATKFDKSTSTVVKTEDEVGISKVGFRLVSWNTKADGSGVSYQPTDTIILSAKITLYAQWESDEVSVTYDPNGGMGNALIIRVFTKTVGSFENVSTIAEVGISYPGFTFLEWNTAADGSGTSYLPGDVMPILDADITLYARWGRNPSNPNTADASVMPLLSVLLLSVVSGVLTGRKRKKVNREDNHIKR